MDNADRMSPDRERLPSRAKPYSKPKLAQYGQVSELTRSGNGGAGDGGSNAGMTMGGACWIAEELYGVQAPQTRLVRAWLKECHARRDAWALVIVPLYGRFGRQVAGLVRRNPHARRIVRPLFDYAVRLSNAEFSAKAAALARG